MTDNDIKKALECCSSSTGAEACRGCPFNEKDICDKEDDAPQKYALDLINRYEQVIKDKTAEFENLIYKLECLLCHATDGRLSKHSYALKTMEAEVSDAMSREYNVGYNEAIKEFAWRLKKTYEKHIVCSFNVLNNEIDNLVKEMTEVTE